MVLPGGGWIAPMLASSGPLPGGPRWAYEVKWDGVRAITATGADGLRLRSRGDRDLTASFPELASLDLECGLVLDAEIIAADGAGRPDFGRLQRRIHHRRPPGELLEQVPVTLVVFDLLRRGATELLARPYVERRAALHELGLDEHPQVQVPPHYLDLSGADMLAVVDAQGLEGVVAKRLDSPYRPGTRSRAWIKHPIRRHRDVAVIGWAPARGRSSDLGALLVAVGDPGSGQLVFAGEVGTGFTQAERRDLLDRLRAREQPEPAIPVRLRSSGWGPSPSLTRPRWVRLGLVGEIAYRELTSDGSFRHPSWRGLRPDRELDERRPDDDR